MKLTMYLNKYLKPGAKIQMFDQDGVLVYEGRVRDVNYSEIKEYQILDVISLDADGNMILSIGKIEFR